MHNINDGFFQKEKIEKHVETHGRASLRVFNRASLFVYLWTRPLVGYVR